LESIFLDYILLINTYNQQNQQNVKRAWKCFRCPEDSAFIGQKFRVDTHIEGAFDS